MQKDKLLKDPSRKEIYKNRVTNEQENSTNSKWGKTLVTSANEIQNDAKENYTRTNEWMTEEIIVMMKR